MIYKGTHSATSRRIEPKDKELEWLGQAWIYHEVMKQGKKTVQELPPEEGLPVHEEAPQRRKAKSFKSLIDALK